MDVEDLMKELEEVQNSDVTHKFSERAAVELISKLMKRGKIDVINTRSGIREYLTWRELETEILQEIDAHDGRVTLSELEEDINVDITYIEKVAKRLCDANCGVVMLNSQEIINDRYTDMIIHKCIDAVEESGLIKAGLLSTRFNLPMSYMTNTVIPGMCSISSSIQAKNGELFTVRYLRRKERFILGFLTGIDHPTQLVELSESYAISNSLLSETAAALIKSHRLLGRVQGGSFIPQHYENEKNDAVVVHMKENQYITKEELRRNQIADVATYFEKRGVRGVKELESVWVTGELLGDLASTLAEFCNEEGYAEVAMVVPAPFTAGDVSRVVAEVPKCSAEFSPDAPTQYTALEHFLVQTAILKEVTGELLRDKQAVVEKVVKARGEAKACFPDAAALEALVSERHTEMDEACASEAAAAILRALETVCKQVFEQHRHEAAASGGASKKASQKETAGALVEFVHAFETVQKLGEAAETAELKAQFAAVEKAMRREGVCLVLRLLQLLNDVPAMEVEALGACSAAGLKEAAAKLPKEAKEYAEQLIGLMSDAKNKEKKPVEKPVEKAAEREKKGKKGKREEVEEKPAVTSFLEGVKLVTDFGGPLFKSYDRKQLRQLTHAKKVELQQKLELVIMQNAGDEERKDLAALAMVKKYSVLPYVPDMTTAKLLLRDYGLENSLLENLFSEDKAVMQKAVMDAIPVLVAKE
ncbi:hypothetical protein WA556_004377 [Blastocystis sp. ATCC 50177/Nand II]